MMKIGEAGNPMPDYPHQKKVREKGQAASAKSVGGKKAQEAEFSETLFHAAEANVKASLDELLKGVQEQGERLARKQDFAELEQYKALVKDFLAKVAKDLYHLKPSSAGSMRPGQKVYVILEKVDLELEKLAKLVLESQTPQLRILEKLDQIRGLLLDAYQ